MPHARPAPLAGWYVISLRPLGRHAAVRRAAAARGAATFALSTLRLQPLDAGAALVAALAAPLVIATSPAAVAFAARRAPLRARRGQRWFAIGAGTTAALRRAGIADVLHPPAGAHSEALLALPELGSIAGRTVGLLTAPGGRDLIAPALRQRGAHVQRANVYRRESVPPAAHRLAALVALPAARSALLVSSGEALEHLWSALDADGRATVRRYRCVVASARLQATATALGFARVVRANGTRPGVLLDALAARVAGASPSRFR